MAKAMYLSFSFGIPTRSSLPTQRAIGDQVAGFIKTGTTEEPLGRQLFREAWSERETRPRSALVIGVAAAEVGFKKLVGTLVPQARWLMDEIQTPPLGTMLRKFLPTLPVKFASPPSVLLKQLDEAVKRRNKLVHAGQPPPKKKRTGKDASCSKRFSLDLRYVRRQPCWLGHRHAPSPNDDPSVPAAVRLVLFRRDLGHGRANAKAV
jgi:hypothetical protein